MKITEIIKKEIIISLSLFWSGVGKIVVAGNAITVNFNLGVTTNGAIVAAVNADAAANLLVFSKLLGVLGASDAIVEGPTPLASGDNDFYYANRMVW